MSHNALRSVTVNTFTKRICLQTPFFLSCGVVLFALKHIPKDRSFAFY